jgi:hypothetical protein
MADECGLAAAVDESETERNARLLASILSERLDVRLDVVGMPFSSVRNVRVRILFDDVVIAEDSDELPSGD